MRNGISSWAALSALAACRSPSNTHLTSTDATLYHDSPQVDTDTDYRFKVGTGDYGDWQQIGGGGGGGTSPVGQLIATVTLAVGMQTRNGLQGWALDANAPAEITTAAYGGVQHADLKLGIPKRFADRHVGWLVQCKIDDVIYTEGTYGIYSININTGGVNEFEAILPATTYADITDAETIKLSVLREATDGSLIINVNNTNAFTIAAGDPVVTIEFRMLMT